MPRTATPKPRAGGKALEISGLTKRYGERVALSSVSLEATASILMAWPIPEPKTLM